MNGISPAPRTIRTALMIVAGMAAMVLVLQVTVASVFRVRDPSIVRWITPYDALSAASLAYRKAGEGKAADLLRADALAATALRRDPTASLAAVAHGLVADQRGDQPMARHWFGYADRIGRRDLATQLWFIEDRVRAGDVPGVLARYDLALRATPSSSAMLFPIMTQAASTPEVGRGLRALLLTRPVWGSGFVSHFIRTSNDPQAMVRITAGVIGRDPVDGAGQLVALVGRLVAQGRHDLAWRAYQAFGRHRGHGIVRDGDFADVTPVSAFEWTYSDALTLLPEHGQDGGRPVLYLPANPDRDGDVARQLVRLDGGTWRLSARIGANGQPRVDAPRFRIRCADENDRTLMEIAFPRSSSAVMLTGRFTTPATCGYAWLSIAVRQPAEPVPGAGPFVTNVAITRE